MAPELPLGLPLAVWIGAGAVVGILLAAVVYNRGLFISQRNVSLCSINVRVSGQHKCPQLGS